MNHVVNMLPILDIPYYAFLYLIPFQYYSMCKTHPSYPTKETPNCGSMCCTGQEESTSQSVQISS